LHKIVRGQVGRVVLAQLDKDEDLMEGILHVLRTEKLRTGYIPTITGALQRARLDRYQEFVDDSDYRVDLSAENLEIAGPVEVTGSGVFGIVESPEQGSRPFSHSGYVHGDPYAHVHLTATNVTDTICGHLVKGGNPVRSPHPVSHFTIFFVEVIGAELQLKCDELHDRMLYHLITEVP